MVTVENLNLLKGWIFLYKMHIFEKCIFLNRGGEKPVKIAEIEKSKIRLSIKTGYKLSTVKFADLGVYFFS